MLLKDNIQRLTKPNNYHNQFLSSTTDNGKTYQFMVFFLLQILSDSMGGGFKLFEK